MAPIRLAVLVTALAILAADAVAKPPSEAGYKRPSNPVCLKSDASKNVLKRKCSEQDAFNYCDALSQTCGATWGTSSWASKCDQLTTPVVSGGCGLATQASLDTLQTQVDVQKTEIAGLQSQIDAIVNNSGNDTNVIPFDAAACLARNITDYTTDLSKGQKWLVMDLVNTPEEICDLVALNPSSCSRVCARIAMKCDPCAIAKVSCQDALAYAVGQAGKSPNLFPQLLETPGPPGPWLQSTCATETVQQQGTFSSDAFGWATAVCSGNDALILEYWKYQKNYWRPDTSDYIDPSTLCNIPIRTVTVGAGTGTVRVRFSGLCYCTV